MITLLKINQRHLLIIVLINQSIKKLLIMRLCLFGFISKYCISKSDNILKLYHKHGITLMGYSLQDQSKDVSIVTQVNLGTNLTLQINFLHQIYYPKYWYQNSLTLDQANHLRPNQVSAFLSLFITSITLAQVL